MLEKGEREKKWVSEGLAEQLKLQHMEFSPTLLWTTIPKWMLQETNVDLKMCNIEGRNKTADVVQEFYDSVEEKYREYVYILGLGTLTRHFCVN